MGSFEFVATIVPQFKYCEIQNQVILLYIPLKYPPVNVKYNVIELPAVVPCYSLSIYEKANNSS